MRLKLSSVTAAVSLAGLASGASEGGCHHEAVFRRNCFTREWSRFCNDDYFVTRLRKSCSRASSGAIHHAQKLATGAYPAYLASPSAMTQGACVAACEALPACKAWSYRTGNPEHVHYRKCFLLGVSSAKYAVTPDSNFESGVCTDGTVSDAPIGAVCNPIGLFGWTTSEPRSTDATMGCNGAAVSEVPPPCYAGMPCLQNRGSPRWKECEKWSWEDSFCAPGFWAKEQSLDTYPNALDAATKTVQVPTVRGSPGAPISTWAELDSARQEWDCAGKEEHKAFGCIEAPPRSPCRRCGASRHGSTLLATEAYKFIQKTYQFAHLRKTVRSPYYGLDGAERCAACPPGEKAAPSDGQADGEDGAYYYGYEYDYEYFYEGGDYYGYYGDDFGAAACARGTDCTDCGSGVLGPNGAIPTWDDDYADDADDAWFDDDADAWWDDDYDFGSEWTGFEDDGYGIGIIQSVDADKKPHPRHSGNHEDTHWFHKRKNKNGTEGNYEVNFTYGFEIFFIGLFALVFGGLFYLSYLDSANKPNHPCAPCAASICPKSAATDDIEQLLGTKAAQD